MYIELFKIVLELICNALKKIRELLPGRLQKIAEVIVAKELGYQICKCTWPPQIATLIDCENYKEKFKCQKCGRLLPPDSSPPSPS